MVSQTYARARFSANPESASAARRFISRALTRWAADDAVPDVALLTCEAVSNAFVHAGTDIEVACGLESGAVRVEVTDRNRTRLVPDPDPGDMLSESGRGLTIVDQLAESWGVSYSGTSKTVWFRCPLPGDWKPAEPRYAEPRYEVPRQLSGPAQNGRFGARATDFLQPSADLVAAPLEQILLAERTQERRGWVAFLAEAGNELDPQPAPLGGIPGIESSALYQPVGPESALGGDFYDLFRVDAFRWCFVLGDVCGSGPEAAAVTGVARNIVRLLAGGGHGAAAILARLNRAIIDDCAPDRFLSMLCAEITPLPAGGARLVLASAGHPLPLLLRRTGQVEQIGAPQLLLGVDHDPGYRQHAATLDPGDVLTCVTDGVTERSDGTRQLDDDSGLARLLAGCTGLSAAAVARRIHSAVLEFAPEPPRDDVAALVFCAR